MLLEYVNEGERDTVGWRVTDSGAVEELVDGGDGWRKAFQLDETGLAELREAIETTLARVDRDHYAPEGSVSHARRLTWRLGGRTIVIDGFPIMKVPLLDELLQTLLRMRFRGEGAVSTVWIWDGHRREFPGEPADVAELAPLLDLVLPPDGGSRGAPEDGTPLLQVDWLVGGEPGDSVEVYPDGRRVLVEDGRRKEADPLSEGDLAELRARLARL